MFYIYASLFLNSIFIGQALLLITRKFIKEQKSNNSWNYFLTTTFDSVKKKYQLARISSLLVSMQYSFVKFSPEGIRDFYGRIPRTFLSYFFLSFFNCHNEVTPLQHVACNYTACMTEHYSNSLLTKQKITDFRYHYLQYLQYNAENIKRAFTQCTHLASQIN